MRKHKTKRTYHHQLGHWTLIKLLIRVFLSGCPTSRKPVTCIHCTLTERVLRADVLEEWSDFTQFEKTLGNPGPWIAGIDFPFGQSRTFIENACWPNNWTGYVAYAASLGRQGFRAGLALP